MTESGRQAKAQIPEPQFASRLEGEYADLLWARKKAAEIADYTYEAVKFRLGPRTFYTPDFMVIHNDGSI